MLFDEDKTSPKSRMQKWHESPYLRHFATIIEWVVDIFYHLFC